MSVPTCPTCDARLTGPELRDGWCEACGKKLPSFVRGGLDAEQIPPQPAPSLWRVYGGSLVVMLGVLLLGATLFAEPPGEPARSRRARAVEELFGKQGSGILCGMFLIGAGGFVALTRPE